MPILFPLIWWLAIAAGSVELALADPLTREAVIQTLQQAGFVTGGVTTLDGKPYRLDRVRVRSTGEGEFTIEFKATPQ